MRKKFEYHFEEVDTDETPHELFAKLGEECWEFVATYKKHERWDDYADGREYSGVNHFNVFVFKRELAG